MVASTTLLNNDREASRYVQARLRDLSALQAEFKSGTKIQTGTQVTTDLGYAQITQTATGWLVNNSPAISFVAVQAYVLARYW